MAATTITLDDTAEAVVTIRLNRPDRLNAIDFPLVGQLHDALDEVAGRDDVKVVVLTGAGRAFCAGMDLRDHGPIPEVGEHRHRHAGVSGQAYLANLTQHIRDSPQIYLAAVNGPAHGGGLALAAACDLRLASTTASFASAFIKTGLTGTDVGVTYLLPRLLGAAAAFDMIITGRTVDADEALRLGLVSRVVPPGDLLDEALDTAAQVASYTTFGLRRTKEVLWHNLEAPSLASAIAMENRNQELAARDPEVIEYMQDYAARITGRAGKD